MVVGRNYQTVLVIYTFKVINFIYIFYAILHIRGLILYNNFVYNFSASQCPALADLIHGNATILNGGGRSYGTIVRFECDPGYVRSGPPVVLCMSNGTWSGEVPTCSRKFKILFYKKLYSKNKSKYNV